MTGRKEGETTLKDALLEGIEANGYLLKLYDDLLTKYTRKLFGRQFDPVGESDRDDLLRFAEILSASDEGSHKIWAQQIVSLLEKLDRRDASVLETKRYVLMACTNYLGLGNEFATSGDLMEDLANAAVMESCHVPNTEGEHFFYDQKMIYDAFGKGNFSYSAPTSLGKTYVMKAFIRAGIKENPGKNYAIIVPTKALIGETKKDIIETMGAELASEGYRVVTAVGDLALKNAERFVFVMTPERMLYLANTMEGLALDYVFVDEAHKLSSNDSRSPLYYDLLDKISRMESVPRVVFSSPNIPNPGIYLRLLRDERESKFIRVSFSPVSQIKYLVDLKEGSVEVYNDFSKKLTKMGRNSSRISLNYVIGEVGRKSQNLVYCPSVEKTMRAAMEFAEDQAYKNDADLERLSKDIAATIHRDYFLVDMVRKGVAFHVGYLPATIRSRIEELYKKGKINNLFCTSTLIEGVNLPADNLFITSYKAGISNFDEVSFRNLIGRVGRISFNLFGNVFLIRMADESEKRDSAKKYAELLEKEIPPQRLSVDGALKKADKEAIVESLVTGDYDIPGKRKNTPSMQFDTMRKFQLILKNDIVSGTETAVSESFAAHLDEKKTEAIRNRKDDGNGSTDISPDQYRSLRDYIAAGHGYPERHFDYDQIVEFLETLSRIFKWETYEKRTLGNSSKFSGNLTHVKYYAVLLLHWMGGDNLSYIIKRSLDYKEKNPSTGVWLNSWKKEDTYNKNDSRHVNYVIADTLNSLDKVILFKILNYFREFSTEYKRFHGIDGRFENDWHEYVEYGTDREELIILQQCGFEREQAKYVVDKGYLDYSSPSAVARFSIKAESIMAAKDGDVVAQAKEAMLNVPELFKQKRP